MGKDNRDNDCNTSYSYSYSYYNDCNYSYSWCDDDRNYRDDRDCGPGGKTPVIVGTKTGTVYENAAKSAISGDLDIQQTGNASTAFVVIAQKVGQYGTFSLGVDGTWQYTLNNNSTSVQALKEGQKVTECFVVTGKSGACETVTVTVVGANDAPVLSGTKAVLKAGTEDTSYTVTAASLLTGYKDVDGGSLSVSNVVADHGKVTLNRDGSFTITPDANYNGVVSLSYSVLDGQGGSTAATQSFKLAEVNDGPALTGQMDALSAGTKGKAYTVSATSLLKGFTDEDGDTLKVTSLKADHGTVKVNSDGTFTITPDSNYTGAMTLSYKVEDGEGGSIKASQSYSVLKANALPTLTGAAAVLAAGMEDVAYTVSKASLLTGFTDADGGVLSVSNVVADHGTVKVNADGSFTVTPDADYNGVVKLSYTVSDGQGGSTAATQKFTVTSVNDAPVLKGAGAVLVAGVEDTAYTVSKASLLTGFVDPEGGALSVSNVVADHGTVIVNADGSFTVTPDADYSGVVNLSYTVSDAQGLSTAATQKFTVTAVNDAPILKGAGAVLAAGLEDTAYTVSAASLLTGYVDPEGGALRVTNLVADHGTVTVNADGTFTITPHADYSGAMQLSYSVADAQGTSVAATQSYNVADVPDNHAPTIVLSQSMVTGAVIEAGLLGSGVDGAAGRVAATDVDPDDSLQWSGSKMGQYGQFNIDANTGEWTYWLDNDLADGLIAGQMRNETFTVKVTDEFGASVNQDVTITIVGQDDIKGIDLGISTIAGSVVEDDGEHFSASGRLYLIGTNPDVANFAATAMASAYGEMVFDDLGNWTYNLYNDSESVQGLAEGQSVVDQFELYGVDGTPQTVSITVHGSYDTPFVFGQDLGAITEDDTVGINGVLAVGNASLGEGLFRPEVVHGDYGDFTMTADGTWFYNIRNAQSLKGELTDTMTVDGLPMTVVTQDAEVVSEKFTVSTLGGLSHEVNVQVVGINDVASISGKRTGEVSEDGVLSASGKLNVVDLDAGEGYFEAKNDLQGLYGSLSVNTDGNWEYQLNNNSGIVQDLLGGQRTFDEFQVTSFDHSASEWIRINIQGAFD